MSGFNNPWYAGIIERFSPDGEESNAALARCMLVSSCILAQAIDDLASKFHSPNVSDSNFEPANIVDVLNSIQCTISEIIKDKE